MLTVHACRGLSDTWALREPPHRHIAHRGEEHKPIDTQKEALCIVGCLVHRRSSANRPLFHLLHRSLHNDTTLSPKQQHPRIPNCSSLRPGRVPASKRSIPQLFTLTRRPWIYRDKKPDRLSGPCTENASTRLSPAFSGDSGWVRLPKPRFLSHGQARAAKQSWLLGWHIRGVPLYRLCASGVAPPRFNREGQARGPEGLLSLSLALFRAVTNDRL